MKKSKPTDVAEQQRLERIRQRAYELWEASGGQHGNDMANWVQAEQEVRAQRKQPRPRTH